MFWQAYFNSKQKTFGYTIRDDATVYLEDGANISGEDDQYRYYELYLNKAVNEENKKEEIVTEQNSIIINMNVLLTEQQYHTITQSETNHYCACCNKQIQKQTWDKHIRKKKHCAKIDEFKPERQFDYGIVRKIKDYYHCGVCNKTIEEDKIADHVTSDIHKENLLLAITKLYEHLNIKESKFSETQHLQEKTLINKTINDICVNAHHKNDTETNDLETEREKSDPDHFRESQKQLFTPIDLKTAQNIRIYEDYSENNITSNPNLQVPMYLKIHLGDKEIRVTFDNWNMLIHTSAQYVYCMICNASFCKIFHKIHCESAQHLEGLTKCVFVGFCDDFVIRQVNERYLHCGRCNNLQLFYAINDHLKLIHKKVENRFDNNRLRGIVPVTTSNSIIVNIPILPFNMIVDENSNLYCAVCDVVCWCVKDHVKDINHVKTLSVCLFLNIFENNMIRAIKGKLHCALCNMVMLVKHIDIHIESESHKIAFNKCFGSKVDKNTKEMLLSSNVAEDKQKIHMKTRYQDDQRHKMSQNEDLIQNQQTPQALIKDDQSLPSTSGIKLVSKSQNIPQKQENKTVKSISENTKELKPKKKKYDNCQTMEKPIEINKESIIVDKPKTNKKGIQIISNRENVLKSTVCSDIINLILKAAHFKISFMALNSLVPFDGARYCFVCTKSVPKELVLEHVQSKNHEENLKEAKFLDKLGMPLFRQMYLMYHCAACNVVMTRKEIQTHLEWEPHIKKYDESCQVTNKNKLKINVKNDVKEIFGTTQKETIYDIDNTVKVFTYKITHAAKNTGTEKITVSDKKPMDIKENKSGMIIIENKLLTINFESWHGLVFKENAIKCSICSKNIKKSALESHVKSNIHLMGIHNKIEKKYYPNLIRQINETTVHCVTCNSEIPSAEKMIQEHIKGRKHMCQYENILKNSNFSDLAEYGDVIIHYK